MMSLRLRPAPFRAHRSPHSPAVTIQLADDISTLTHLSVQPQLPGQFPHSFSPKLRISDPHLQLAHSSPGLATLSIRQPLRRLLKPHHSAAGSFTLTSQPVAASLS